MTTTEMEDLPERKLVMAVIMTAIEGAVTIPTPRMKEYRKKRVNVHAEQARAWLFSESTEPCSLDWWCNLIGMDAGYVQRKARAYIKQIEEIKLDK